MPSKRILASSKGFHQGVVYSAGIVVSQFDQPADARDLLASAGGHQNHSSQGWVR